MPGGESRYGQQRLSPGFAPAPFMMNVHSGGDIDVKSLRLGDNCLGYAAADPDFIVDLGATFDRIIFLIASKTDTTLIINLPNGGWACNDDANGLNPALVFHKAAAGVYQIWIGSYAAETIEEAVLYVSEAGPESLPTTATGPDPARDPLYGDFSLAPGFQPAPFAVQFIGGGRSQTADYVAGEHCHGYVSEAPDYSVYLSEGAASLWFGVYSPADMTLLISDAAGNWHCGDKGAGDHPLIRLDFAAAGFYDIWVGSAEAGNYAAAMFYLSGSEPDDAFRFAIDTNCAGLRSTALQVGELAVVSPRLTAGNPIHAAPETATTEVFRAPPGSALRLVGGPVCADERRWWRAEFGDGLRGWIADGDHAAPWLERAR